MLGGNSFYLLFYGILSTLKCEIYNESLNESDDCHCLKYPSMSQLGKCSENNSLY